MTLDEDPERLRVSREDSGNHLVVGQGRDHRARSSTTIEPAECCVDPQSP
jgi:hypothetical protein